MGGKNSQEACRPVIFLRLIEARNFVSKVSHIHGGKLGLMIEEEPIFFTTWSSPKAAWVPSWPTSLAQSDPKRK